MLLTTPWGLFAISEWQKHSVIMPEKNAKFVTSYCFCRGLNVSFVCLGAINLWLAGVIAGDSVRWVATVSAGTASLSEDSCLLQPPLLPSLCHLYDTAELKVGRVRPGEQERDGVVSAAWQERNCCCWEPQYCNHTQPRPEGDVTTPGVPHPGQQGQEISGKERRGKDCHFLPGASARMALHSGQ